MYNPPDKSDWLCATAAAEIVQAMVPDTCRVVVNESERQPRRRRGYDSTVAAVGSLPQETASACAALTEGYIILVIETCLLCFIVLWCDVLLCVVWWCVVLCCVVLCCVVS